MSRGRVRVRRVYDGRVDDDGQPILVDRLWPRGLSKSAADLDEWCKAVAPSTELRNWYRHDATRFPEFARRYQAELAVGDRAAALTHLRQLVRTHPSTLLTATKQPEMSEAAVLADVLKRRGPRAAHPAGTDGGPHEAA